MPDHPRSVSQLDQLDDAALAQLACDCVACGDPAERETAGRCVGVLVARHRDLVRTVIAAKVPPVDVDDVESIVFGRFATAVYSGRQVHNPPGLLVRLATWARADHHAGRRPPEHPIEEWDDAQEDPELDRAATEAAVAQLLAPLSDRQREVVWRRLLDGESSAAVAARLGTTPGNIDVIMHRALGVLREAAS